MPEASTQAPIKGRGRIYVSPGFITPEDVKPTLTGNVCFDLTEVQGQFDAWHKTLLLPDSYIITGIYFDVVKKLWLIIVESEHIPLPPIDPIEHTTLEDIPTLLPTYFRAEDGKAEITNIKMWDSQTKEYRALWEEDVND